ncbi:MAG: carbon storage regulator CsrA [Proteobacteria bacterium]|nr:carbon storage regulator CsrA [Pseudomonadota bacterium]
MLVLTRKSGQGIWIGDDVRVVVLESKDGQVRLGIEAPAEKIIHRDEIYKRIEEQNIKALTTLPLDISKTLKQFKRRQDD